MSRISACVFASLGQMTALTTAPDAADVVWRAVNDTSRQLRYPAGADAVALAGSVNGR